VQQQAEPIVAEVPEAVPDALDLLDQQVDALGHAVRPAGGVEREHFVFPRADRLREPPALTHTTLVAVRVEPREAPTRG
jgi:hypothetical protein